MCPRLPTVYLLAEQNCPSDLLPFLGNPPSYLQGPQWASFLFSNSELGRVEASRSQQVGSGISSKLGYGN